MGTFRLAAPASLLVALGVALNPVQAQPASRRSDAASAAYERATSPLRLSPSEQRAARIIQRWGGKRGQPMTLDWRLVRAARRLVSAVPSAQGATIDLREARREAERQGWTDGQLAALALRLPASANIEEALVRELDREITPVEVNRVGLSATSDGSDTLLLVLLSRRLVELAPVPARLPLGDRLVLSGRVLATTPNNAPAVVAVVALPNGQIERRGLATEAGGFKCVLSVGSTVGVLRAQILLDRGQGPEIAALFDVGIDADPFAPEARAQGAVPAHGGSAASDTAAQSSATEIEASLSDLILARRKGQGLPEVPTLGLLAEVARGHAEDMCAHGFFAHRSPTTGDLPSRLRRRSVRYRRALENIAVGTETSARDVFEQWNDSPAHRANLLDQEVTSLGVGVVLCPGAARPKLYAVVVLARLDS